MSIHVLCPWCGSRLILDSELAGTTQNCPKCRRAMSTPQAPETAVVIRGELPPEAPRPLYREERQLARRPEPVSVPAEFEEELEKAVEEPPSRLRTFAPWILLPLLIAVAGVGGWLARDHIPGLQGGANAIPESPVVRSLLEQAGRFYSETGVIWPACVDAAEQLRRDGRASEPREILDAACEVGRALKASPGGLSIHSFVGWYLEARRIPLSHVEATLRLKRIAFGASERAAEEESQDQRPIDTVEARNRQELAIADTVYIGLSGQERIVIALVDPPTKVVEVDSGTAARVEQIEVHPSREPGLRSVYVRILDGPYAGRLSNLKPDSLSKNRPGR